MRCCYITSQKSSGWVESAWSRGRWILHFGGIAWPSCNQMQIHSPGQTVHWLVTDVLPVLLMVVSLSLLVKWRTDQACLEMLLFVPIDHDLVHAYLVRIGGVVPYGNDWDRIRDPTCRPYSREPVAAACWLGFISSLTSGCQIHGAVASRVTASRALFGWLGLFALKKKFVCMYTK